MTSTQTQSNPAPKPDAQPVTAATRVAEKTTHALWLVVADGREIVFQRKDHAEQFASAPALLAERDGYRQALDEMLACHELRAHKGEAFTPLQIKAADVARAALQLARGAK